MRVLQAIGLSVALALVGAVYATGGSGDESLRPIAVDGNTSPIVLAQTVQRRQSEQAEILPADLQAALERGNAGDSRRLSRQLGIAATGGRQGYICHGGNCSCAGVQDCLAFVADNCCVKGTNGCNDYGCTCKASGADTCEPENQ